jgi:RES domain-containing protein
MPVVPGALNQLGFEPVSGRFFRLIRSRFADQPLAMTGALLEGGRYNVAHSFGALYLGFDEETCQFEVQEGVLAGCEIKPGAYVLWDYNVSLEEVVRLDDDANCARIGVTQKEISVPGEHQWASLIGEPLFARGLEALVAPSAHRTNGKCLDIFLDNLRESSKVDARSRVKDWPSVS